MSETATPGSIRERVILASLVLLKCFFYRFIFNRVVSKMTVKSTGMWPDSKTICMSSEKRDIQERQGRGQAQTAWVNKNAELWKRDGLS